MRTTATITAAPDFHAIFRATAAPHLILDPGLVIVEVNEAYLHATKRERGQLLGKYVFEAFPDNPDAPQADSVKNLKASLERVLRTREADRMPEQKYDIPVGDPQAGRFEERYWSPVNTPLFDRDGALTHIIHQVEDITSRVLYETALRDSETRFRALTNATADVVYRMSPDWRFMHQLDGRGFLKTTAAWGAYRIEDYVYPEDLALARHAIDEAIRNKTIFALEHRVLRADGSHGWTYSKAVPILDAQGGILEWIGSASDITERKLAEQELKEAGRRKDEFLAMLAHELRNPLAPISAAAQLLQLRAPEDTRVRQASQVIGRQVEHMTSLVDELLDVSRVACGLVTLDCSALDVRQVVTDAVEQVVPIMQARAHHLEVRHAAEPGRVSGDRKRLVQIIANLLNNAAKFTPEGGKLGLKTTVLASQVHIEVIDNGIGMTPDTAEHAFDLFAQAERSADRSQGGLGLGLALVKSLVELHGGSVRCESAGLGRGSRFIVRLPRLLSSAACDAPEPGYGLARAAAPAGLSVLVVDDNADAAGMLAMVLEAQGHTVLVAHEPLRAIAMARQHAPDACVLDIGLPGMSGYELAQRLRAQAETARSVLIAVTGYGQDGDRERSAASGFDRHLVKPVDMAQLSSALLAAGAP